MIPLFRLGPSSNGRRTWPQPFPGRAADAEGEARLVSFIKEILAKRTPESHLAADIPTRGTPVRSAADADFAAFGLTRDHDCWIFAVKGDRREVAGVYKDQSARSAAGIQ